MCVQKALGWPIVMGQPELLGGEHQSPPRCSSQSRSFRPNLPSNLEKKAAWADVSPCGTGCFVHPRCTTAISKAQKQHCNFFLLAPNPCSCPHTILPSLACRGAVFLPCWGGRFIFPLPYCTYGTSQPCADAVGVSTPFPGGKWGHHRHQLWGRNADEHYVD